MSNPVSPVQNSSDNSIIDEQQAELNKLKLDQELGLSKPTKYAAQDDSVWENLFGVIRVMHIARVIRVYEIPEYLDYFGTIIDEDKPKFISDLLEKGLEAHYYKELLLEAEEAEEFYAQLQEAIDHIPEEYMEQVLSTMFGGTIPQDLLDQMGVTSSENLEDLSEDQVKNLAQSAVYRYRENGLNLATGQRKGFSNNTKPMTKEELSRLLDSTKDIQTQIEDIPVNGFNPLLDNSASPLSGSRPDGFRDSSTSLSKLLGQKQKNLIAPAPAQTETTSSPVTNSRPLAATLAPSLNISGAKATTRSLLNQKRQNSTAPVITKPAPLQSNSNSGLVLPRIPTPLNPNFRRPVPPKQSQNSSFVSPSPTQFQTGFAPVSAPRQSNQPATPSSAPGPSSINKF